MNNFHLSCVSNNVWAIIRWNEYEWRAHTYAERQSDFLKMKYFKYHNYIYRQNHANMASALGYLFPLLKNVH